MYGFQSYISVSILRGDGSFFGTICALDLEPAKLKDGKIVPTISLFAELVSAQLDLAERAEESRAALSGERDASDLREQFIAVLGHDLRNPLASLMSGVEMLDKKPDEVKARAILGHMRHSG